VVPTESWEAATGKDAVKVLNQVRKKVEDDVFPATESEEEDDAEDEEDADKAEETEEETEDEAGDDA